MTAEVTLVGSLGAGPVCRLRRLGCPGGVRDRRIGSSLPAAGPLAQGSRRSDPRVRGGAAGVSRGVVKGPALRTKAWVQASWNAQSGEAEISNLIK